MFSKRTKSKVSLKMFLLLMAAATLLSSWVLPTWLWQFGALKQIFS